MADTKTEFTTVTAKEPKPITVELTTDRVSDPSLTKLAELNRELRERIEKNVKDADVKKLLLARLDEDKNLIGAAGIDRLNDNKEKDLLGDKHKGLSDRQEETKNVFGKNLKEDQEKINQILADMHEVRVKLLNQELLAIHRRTILRGYNKFNDYMGREGSKDVTARIPGQPLPLPDLLKEAGPQKSFRNAKTGEEVHFDGKDVIRGKDPIAVGYAAAAEGSHKNFVFGGKVENALASAEAFLNAGGEDFSLEDHTMQDLTSFGTGYWDNDEDGFKRCNAKFKELRARVDARKRANLDTPTTIFNADVKPARALAEAFGRLHGPDQHRGFLREHSSAVEQAQLAMELKRLNEEAGVEKPYHVFGSALDEHEYIRYCLSGLSPNNMMVQAYDQAYDDLQSTPEQLEAFRNKTDLHEIIKTLTDIKTPAARAKHYAEIPRMANDPVFRNQVRAAALAAIVDQHYIKLKDLSGKELKKDQFKDAPDSIRHDVANVLKGVDPQDLKEIQSIYTANFERGFAKIQKHNELSTDQFTRTDVLSGSRQVHSRALNAPEGAHQNPLMIKTNDDLRIYLGCSKPVHDVLVDYQKNTNNIPAADFKQDEQLIISDVPPRSFFSR